jgi:hypothetical protein
MAPRPSDDSSQDPLAQLLDDLYAAEQKFRDGHRRDSWVIGVTAMVRMLQAYRPLVSPETSASLNTLGLPLLLLAEVLEAVPADVVAKLEQHPVINRQRRALAAASVEALIRTGWERHQAADYVGLYAGVTPTTAIGWRDTLQREPRTTFAELEAELAAHPERVGRQPKDVALYHEWLDMTAGDAMETVVERIRDVLATFGVSQSGSKITHKNVEG